MMAAVYRRRLRSSSASSPRVWAMSSLRMGVAGRARCVRYVEELGQPGVEQSAGVAFLAQSYPPASLGRGDPMVCLGQLLGHDYAIPQAGGSAHR